MSFAYRHFGDGATFGWTCGQSQMPKLWPWLWHGARILSMILSGLVAKVKMAKMTDIRKLDPEQKYIYFNKRKARGSFKVTSVHYGRTMEI